jgi:F420-dependent oxidoreductase-like protein
MRQEARVRKISMMLGWNGNNSKELIADAKVADAGGVDSLFVAETWGQDPFTLLTLLAYETQHIKLGTAIANIYARSPAVLAQHFATLDQLSNGRMIIGLGTSGPKVIEHFHGVKFEKPFTRMREYVEIINMLMRREKLVYPGKVFQLERGFRLRMEPVRPHIPIWIASINPKSVQQTAEIADGWLPIFLPKEQWKAQLAVLFDAVEAAGRRREQLQVRCPYTITVTDHPEHAAQSRRMLTVRYIARMGDFYYDLFVRMGYRAEADAVRAGFAQGGEEGGMAVLSDRLVDQLGFAGGVEACCDALDEAAEAGFSDLSVSVSERDPQKREAIYRKLVG